jgi:hypothetical protein
MTADGTTGILAVSEDAQFPRAQPPGDNLNHFQSELRASAILLFGSLPGLFLFRPAIAAGSQLWTVAFAIEADEDREGPGLPGSERKRDLEGENDPAMAEREDGPLPGGTQRIMMHAGTPDVASGLTRESVIDRCGQHFRTERQQKLEDTVTESIKVPAGLTEEAVKGGVVFEAAQLSGLDYTCERSAAGAENPGAGQGPEGGEAGLGKAGLKGEQERSKRPDEEIRHRRALNLSSML